MNREQTIATAWGIGTALLFHAALSLLLMSAAAADSENPVAANSTVEEAPRRREAAEMQTPFARRIVEGAQPRTYSHLENRFGRRTILADTGRRDSLEESGSPFRFIELSRGRKGLARTRKMKKRGIDFGPADDTDILHAMLIPKLGLKQADKRKLPRLTKYEQPEKQEDGVNISRKNPDGEAIKHKSFKHKKAQRDRKRRKKPSLGELIDAPEDDDPRKRATRLDNIVGSADGSTFGVGTEAKEGNVYLSRVERSIRTEFRVPVFLSQDELKKLVVEIQIQQMDDSGRIVKYKMRRKSTASAFDSAALEAIKRFVSKEGGSKTLPAPEADMLEYINKRGILVRLEGRKLR